MPPKIIKSRVYNWDVASFPINIQDSPVLLLGVMERQSKKTFAGEIVSGTSRFNVKISEKNLVDTFLQERMCRDDIEEEFLQDLVDFNEILFVMFYVHLVLQPTRRGDQYKRQIEPVGFASAREINSSVFYIDLICVAPKYHPFVRHTGAVLMGFIEDYVRKNAYREIQLRSVPVVLMYYPRFGYQHRPSCTTEPDKHLIRLRDALYKQLMDTGFPDTNAKAIDNRSIQRFLVELQKAGYGSMREECDPTGKTDEEILRDILPYEDGGRNCHGAGFLMRKCL